MADFLSAGPKRTADEEDEEDKGEDGNGDGAVGGGCADGGGDLDEEDAWRAGLIRTGVH